MPDSILIADDDDSMLEVCEVGLRHAGYAVTTCISGDQALKRIAVEPFDLVLSDLQMPGADGHAVVRGVKATRPSTEVIIMTGAPSLQTAIATLKDGAYDYIVKPFHVDDLLATVDRCLQHHRLKQELTSERAMRQELQAAYAELQKVEQLKEAFLARLNHELKTPLSELEMSIAILSETVDKEISAAQRESLSKFLRMADSGAKRMNRTISELLAFVDLQRRDVPEPRTAVDMERVCRVLIDRMKPLMEPRKISVDLSFAPGTKPVSGNIDLLSCAMEHLIHNSILFNREGGTVTIRGETRRERVCISVADTGEGIPEAEFNKIFDSFYQIAEYLTRKVDGLGLGLAMTRRIVELHGGESTVTSKMGSGTTFTVYLPPA